MVLGEGAGAVVLEDLDRAMARGATVYAELLGGASSSVAGLDRQADRSQALRNALEMTFRRTGIGPDAIGFINAHGLGTRSADVEEARAIHDVFGQRHDAVPVVAPKSHFGNLGAGSGMVELIAGVLALRYGRLFPVLNYDSPDPDCPVAAVRIGCEPPAGTRFVNLSFTPQGQASVALLTSVASQESAG
jgi:3-oxoacyl-[acyl-carrier-protein] synthase II